MNSSIQKHPYIWRFVNQRALFKNIFQESDGECIYGITDVLDQNHFGKIMDLDNAFLELRTYKDGSIEEHVSFLWTGSIADTCGNPDVSELMSAMNVLGKKFQFPHYFSFVKIPYLKVLKEIKNTRNNLITFKATNNASTPPAHCEMWLSDNMKNGHPNAKLNRLKVYTAIINNSKTFLLESAEKKADPRDFKFGYIADLQFHATNTAIRAVKGCPHKLLTQSSSPPAAGATV